jgi:integrase
MRLYHRLNSGLPATETKPKHAMSALIRSYKVSTRWPEKASTQASYSGTLNKIEAKVGDLDCRKFTRPAIITIRDKLATTSRREADKQVTMYSILFEHAIDKGLITHNPAKGVARVNKAREYQPWPAWAMQGFEENANQLTRTIYEMALGTAQRLTTCLTVRWDQLEELDGILGANIEPDQNKTGWEGWVPLTPRLTDYLATLSRSLTTIVADKQGKPLDRHRAQKLLAKVRPLYGGEGYSWHGLRYNATAEMGELSDEVIGSVTGHKSSAMVRKYAGKGRQRRLAKAARKPGTGT